VIPGLNERPVVIALAGSNGAGKSTFYGAHLRAAGFRLVNADILARELGVDAYRGAELAGALREKLLEQQESFVFETVFSDPVGDKISFLKRAAGAGYNVILCFIGISDPAKSEERVAMRVTQGGHDVPAEKLAARFPRTLENLRKGVRTLPLVFVFDNNDLSDPYRQIAIFHNGKADYLSESLPVWMQEILEHTKPAGKGRNSPSP
jgi:predicted ABC-type ATPase